jgi:long-chain acyl-CoA synthetase
MTTPLPETVLKETKTLQTLIDGLADYGARPAMLRMMREDVLRHTYREMAELSSSLSRGLTENGVRPGERIGLFSELRFEAATAALAVMRAGAVVIPLDIQFSHKTLSMVLEDSGPSLFFTTSRHAARLRKASPKSQIFLLDQEFFEEKGSEGRETPKAGTHPSWTDLFSKGSQELPALRPEDHAALFYTSGTTGPPKGVPLSHENLAFQLETIRSQRLITQKDRVLLPLPLHHVYPFVIGMLVPLSLGVSIVVPQSLTGPQIIRAVTEGKVTTIIGVPRLYKALLTGIRARAAAAAPGAEVAFSALLSASLVLRRRLGVQAGKKIFRSLHDKMGPDLRILASGGSPLDPELAWKLEGMGWQVAIGYGLTETAPLLTLNPPGKARIGSVGLPVDGVTLRIDPSALPEDMAEEQKGGQGEVLAKGPGIFQGYLHMEEKTREVFTEDGWFRTGDLGYVDPDGYLYISGRASTLIVTPGGENVQPDEVEEAYEGHPFIREAGVLQDEDKLVAVIVPDLEEIQKKGGELQELIRKAVSEQSKRMPTYQRISDFAVTRESLPRTRLGKIRRHLLAERFERAKHREEGTEGKTGPVSLEEMSDQDRALLESKAAWRTWEWLTDRYRDRRITPDTSPQLDLGVDSMEWLNLTMEIREKTGVELRDEAIGRITTVRDLLEEVTEAVKQGVAPEMGEALKNPDKVLNRDQKRWLRPLGPLMAQLSKILYILNRELVRVLFRQQTHGYDLLSRDTQLVFTPNHASYLDPFVLAAALPQDRLHRTYWAGWTGAAFHNPINTLVSRLAKTIPIDPEKGLFSSLALAAAVLKEGKSLVWFPEGRRSPSGDLQAFRPGIGILLAHIDATVVPVFISGTETAMPVGKVLPKRTKIHVTFGRPVSSRELAGMGGEHLRERIAAALHDRVAALAGEEREPKVE